MESQTIRTKTGMAVGTLKGNILHKRIRSSKHLFRSIGEKGSWGCDYSILYDELPEKGVVRLIDQDHQKIYQTTVALWKEKGITRHFKQGTVDHNTQVFLPVEFFDVITTEV
jgi:hypothetical protein